MTLFSSLTNRIFVASAMLAVLAIAFAVYRVNVAVTAQAENELRRGIEEAGTLLEEYRTTIFEHYSREARLVADLSNFKAALTTLDVQTVQPIADNYQRQIDSDLFLVTDPHGPRARRGRAASIAARQRGIGGRDQARRARDGNRVAVAAPGRGHPGRVRAELDHRRAPRHAERGVQPGRAHRGALQGAHEQRDRVRRGSAASKRPRCRHGSTSSSAGSSGPRTSGRSRSTTASTSPSAASCRFRTPEAYGRRSTRPSRSPLR